MSDIRLRTFDAIRHRGMAADAANLKLLLDIIARRVADRERPGCGGAIGKVCRDSVAIIAPLAQSYWYGAMSRVELLVEMLMNSPAFAPDDQEAMCNLDVAIQ